VAFIHPFFVALIPYTYIGWVMMSGNCNQNPSVERVFISVFMYVTGVIFMMGSDA